MSARSRRAKNRKTARMERERRARVELAELRSSLEQDAASEEQEVVELSVEEADQEFDRLLGSIDDARTPEDDLLSAAVEALYALNSHEKILQAASLAITRILVREEPEGEALLSPTPIRSDFMSDSQRDAFNALQEKKLAGTETRICRVCGLLFPRNYQYYNVRSGTEKDSLAGWASECIRCEYIVRNGSNDGGRNTHYRRRTWAIEEEVKALDMPLPDVSIKRKAG